MVTFWLGPPFVSYRSVWYFNVVPGVNFCLPICYEENCIFLFVKVLREMTSRSNVSTRVHLFLGVRFFQQITYGCSKVTGVCSFRQHCDLHFCWVYRRILCRFVFRGLKETRMPLWRRNVFFVSLLILSQIWGVRLEPFGKITYNWAFMMTNGTFWFMELEKTLCYFFAGKEFAVFFRLQEIFRRNCTKKQFFNKVGSIFV